MNSTAYSADFYIGGVSMGRCDPRIFLKCGDTVSFQLHDMSSAEKRKLKKQLGSTSSVIPEHMATLLYFASEKRPKSAVQSPGTYLYFYKMSMTLQIHLTSTISSIRAPIYIYVLFVCTIVAPD